MSFDYVKYNYCIGCKIRYLKSKIYCDKCKMKNRQTPRKRGKFLENITRY